MLKNKSNKGFTIIEVLIVLAIAGLILLIVFLAVPALQRNARNTAIKNDVQSVLGGVSDYEGANNGAVPTAISGTGKITYTTTGAKLNDTTINIQGSTQVTSQTKAPSGAAPATGTIVVSIGYRCDQKPSTRAVAAEYAIETSGSNAVYQCVDS